MIDNYNQSNIEAALGYTFKDASLLRSAFTHSSRNDTESNERLVFLGRKLLYFVASDYLFSRFPFSTEKQLNLRLDAQIKALEYDKFVSRNKLSKYIRLSDISEALRDSEQTHGEIFLSVIAAIFKDGGLASLKAFLLPLLRACDGDTHYVPKFSESTDAFFKQSVSSSVSSSGKSEGGKQDLKDTDYKKSSPDTIENTTEDKKTKKKGFSGAILLKAITLSSKKNKAEAKSSHDESKPTKEKTVKKKLKEQPKADDTAKPETSKGSFIRDALTPVFLPDEMKYGKSGKSSSKKDFANENASDAKKNASSDKSFGAKSSINIKSGINDKTETNSKTSVSTALQSDSDNENYKSLLQEYVQKNIRSANVLLKYTSERLSNGAFSSSVSLDNHYLAKGEGSSKKTSERLAAKAAYLSLTDKSSDTHAYFRSLSENGIILPQSQEDYISKLNQYCQKKQHTSSAPVSYEKRVSQERKKFSVAVIYNGEEIAVGSGSTLKDAKQSAAKCACKILKI